VWGYQAARRMEVLAALARSLLHEVSVATHDLPPHEIGFGIER
jgi:hypothetical protein